MYNCLVLVLITCLQGHLDIVGENVYDVGGDMDC